MLHRKEEIMSLSSNEWTKQAMRLRGKSGLVNL
jgi:hypothetical protein